VQESDVTVERVLRPARSGGARRHPLARRRRRAGRALPRRLAGGQGRPADHHRPGAVRGRSRTRRSAGRRRAGPPDQRRQRAHPRAAAVGRQRDRPRELDER
jgi:hypothetical protein